MLFGVGLARLLQNILDHLGETVLVKEFHKLFVVGLQLRNQDVVVQDLVQTGVLGVQEVRQLRGFALVGAWNVISEY